MFGLVLVVVPATGTPQVASACSARACIEGYAYPSEGASAPAGAPALVLRPPGFVRTAAAPIGPPVVRLLDARGNSVPVEVESLPAQGQRAFVVIPEVLAAGRYTLEAEPGSCSDIPLLSQAIEVGPSAPLPASLGNLQREGPPAHGLVPVSEAASCYREVVAVRQDLRLELSAEAEPWRELLILTTYVDDEPWFHSPRASGLAPVGGSWQGRGVDAVFAECQSSQPDASAPRGLPPGRHSVRMEGFVAGTATLLRTADIEVNLDCASSPDAGVAAPDAEPGPELPSPIEAPPPKELDAAEGCRSTGRGPLALSGFLLIAGRTRLVGRRLCRRAHRDAALAPEPPSPIEAPLQPNQAA